MLSKEEISTFLQKRYLSGKGYQRSILRADEFKGSREVMSAKRKELKHEGLGRKPNRAQPLSEEDEEILWSSGQLGAHNPVSLQNSVWWRNNFFGLRGRQEHRDMKWGDVSITTDHDGQQFIEYKERDTKTRKDPRQERSFNPRIYATPDQPDRCPVNLLIQYTHKRPISMLQPESPFYLSVLPQSQQKPNTWYKNCPLGIHNLGNIMKDMSEKAGLGKLTNHSGRKTTVKRLREACIDSNDIIQLTGHKNIQSVNNYSDVSIKKQKQMSNILVTGSSIEPKASTMMKHSVLPASHSVNVLPVSCPANVLPVSCPADVLSVPHPVDILSAPHPVDILSAPHPVDILSAPHPVDGLHVSGPVDILPLQDLTNITSINSNTNDFDPNDGFEDLFAEIEKLECNTNQQLNVENCRSVVPNGKFSNCIFNFTINFNK